MAGAQNFGESSHNPVAINVTAMVDVIFCLCIFFMCSFHFKQLQGKVETWLPDLYGSSQGTANAIHKDEIGLVLRWDPATQTVTRNLRHQAPVNSDDELMSTVLQIAGDYTRAGNTTFPLVIDADGEVPWTDVVHVMDLCKRNKIERIEFAAPQREIDPLAPPGSAAPLPDLTK